MRLAIGLLDFSQSRGGAERYLVDLSHRLALEGHEVHVFARRWEEDSSTLQYHRIKTIPFPKSVCLLSFARQATRKMKAGRFDLTFGVGNTLEVDVLQPHGGVHWAWFWRSLRAYDRPWLRAFRFLGRVLSMKQWVSGWIENSPYRREKLSRIIAISDMVKQDMISWYGIPSDRITVVYNGVDTNRFHPQNRKDRTAIRKRHGIGEEIVLLFVSNNFQMKGLGHLMRALSSLKRRGSPAFKLLVLGRDRQQPYRRLARRLGLSGEAVFAGTTLEPEKYYGAADLLVHPSFYDACSLTVLEAMASGLPVITTSSNGAAGIVQQGREGFVISDATDEGELEEKIAFFFHPHRREQASLAARSLAEDYSAERNWRAMKAIFEETEGRAR